MTTRILELRKTLKLSATEFGKNIGLKPSSMSDIEHGRSKLTERVIIAICAKYNVNEEWLRTGKGEMFIKENRKFNEFFEIFNKVNEPLQDFLIQCAKSLLDAQKKL